MIPQFRQRLGCGILTFFHPIENILSSIFCSFAPDFGERVGSRNIG